MTRSIDQDRTDQELIAGVRAGDGDSFDALHGRYRDRVYRFALKRLGDPCEAEDVTQEVFLQVFRCIGAFEGRSTLLTWMFGITHNQVCRRFRRKTPTHVSMDHIDMELASGDVPVDRAVDAARLLHRFEDVVDTELPPTQRQAFHLRYRENRSTRAIAREMGKSSQAVKISLFRARRALQQRAKAHNLPLSAA
ncbi:MAG: sigma-70 family RNA polymerase sigma factor [Proteobacteria bacterium]|nr:sigma-70 family RNA polymerase sigma factor [Pseudomonadota bacterium]